MNNVEEKGHRKNNYSRFDSMDTEVLEDLLKADFDAKAAEQMDVDETLYIAHLIAERKGVKHKELDVAKEEFFEHYYPLKDESDDLYEDEKIIVNVLKLGLWRRLAGAVAAVFLVVVCSGVTAFALGYDPFGFRAIWNDDIFWFEDENVAEQMQELVMPYDDVENLLPKWIPGRYEVYEESLSDDEDHIDSYVVYANSETDVEDILYVGIWYWPNSPLYYQKDTQEVVVYTLNETDFYIMFDRDWTNVVWRNGQVEYYIMGRISEKEAKKMIKSIYN